MIDYQLDKANSILHVSPESSLDKSDFAELAKVVDPEIEAGGALAGLIIEAKHFPGWDSFGALVNHIRFVRDHHRHVKKIAIVTDSHMGDLAQHLGSHFVAAQIRHFAGGESEQATNWITGGE
ncbi:MULTISPECIES: SpoIIAA family protein [Mycobacterium]|uniref:STAS/SEC14 domain-containing protein n=1 Tax=Mycobacterium kiyosense TaxID=2871094 RepID=A0A9P3QBG5_9MYCO|nr:MULTISPECIES: STAS/SEC14 domain-containing protein [Mycobacterium]BDB40689.1 hypothetical protein IWGMT90018_11350 [Mycobacterium kiyosense]BDE12496.1 hypothetical protein MKCMC460_13560 [Mycobacterium sp. 20KCMC460]GLB84335.1 hypothetical protein SRL2020028_35910 [Mycobacterium kiyosense]GLB90984.1 hypothetical protein SRL2020130_38010 [Mycobacterium kiyosense]GLB97016.1 hypothetical protein SRL2020226_37920 [Mycobacterium kiyosense]